MRLSDRAVMHLRELTEQPDFTATRYRLVREIGRGGMGVVYEAEDRALERSVALKVLATELVARDAAERIRAEAKTLAGLEHPGIVPVHDVGELEDGRVWYAMRLVRGMRLEEWASQSHSRTERLRLFARICEPVAFAHANGIVHRDLKPENVMVADLGSVHVMDWGVARSVAEDGGPEIVGTQGYMSPEQQRGEPTNPSSDVFALGRVLAFLLGDEPMPRRIAAIIRRATADRAADRYSDARQLAKDVIRFLDDEPVSAYRENIIERLWRWLVQNRVLIALIGAYIVMRMIVFFWTRL